MFHVTRDGVASGQIGGVYKGSAQGTAMAATFEKDYNKMAPALFPFVCANHSTNSFTIVTKRLRNERVVSTCFFFKENGS